ncbi:MAG: HrpE/YscL family type III secretion apparatus protein [Verrucomicrobia bacterium]|nr:HrpE/YscL family type III secretion apparatus protein [Verrucomicrobiota bacterium]
MEKSMYTFSLIQKGSIHTGKDKIIPKKDFETLLSAKQVLTTAKKEAKELHEETLLACEKLKEEAKEAGYQDGLAKFYEHLFAFDEKIKVLRHEMQKAVLPLVLKATKRIIGDEIEMHPESVVPIVLQAVKAVLSCRVVKLYVNKDDLPILEKHKKKLKAPFEHLESFHLEERSDVARGSCIIETEKGILNATLENQYRALERAFETFIKRR